MLNIIKADLYRIFKGKAIYITLLVMIIMQAFSIFIMSPGSIGLSGNIINQSSEVENVELTEKLVKAKTLKSIREIIREYGAFPLDKQIIGANVNLYYVFIVLVVIILTIDLSNSTIKNSLSSSISRKKYYLSKLVTCLLVSTGIVIFNNSFVYILNLLINGSSFSSTIGSLIKITLYQLPLMYGIISMLIAISFLTKKTAIYNSISIPFISVVQLLIMGISALFRLKSANIMKYELQFALSSLADNPQTQYLLNCIGLGLLYFVIFNLIGYLSFCKAEIK